MAKRSRKSTRSRAQRVDRLSRAYTDAQRDPAVVVEFAPQQAPISPVPMPKADFEPQPPLISRVYDDAAKQREKDQIVKMQAANNLNLTPGAILARQHFSVHALEALHY